jgi:Tol biopolymer transport system component
MLLGGVAVAVAPAFSEELAEELKRVPYRIVYESYQDENWDLFMIRADGSGRVNLTRTPKVNELYPHVSPDGKQISFAVDAGDGEDKTRDLYVMNFDGTGRRLVARGARDGCWTADGRSLVYLKNEFEKLALMDYVTKEIFLHDVATGRDEEHPNRELCHLYCICCTPDGKWYVSTVHGGMGFSHAILAIEARGQRMVKLSIPGCRPDVSADGRRIAWASGDYSLGIGDLDCSGPEPRVMNVRDVVVSTKPIKVQHVDWSPDGRYVAFSYGVYKKGLGLAPSLVGVRAPGWNIAVADAKATNRWVAITTDGNSNKEPDWVPAR